MDRSIVDLEEADRIVTILRQRLDLQGELADSRDVEQEAAREEAALGMIRVTLAEALVHREALARELTLQGMARIGAA